MPWSQGPMQPLVGTTVLDLSRHLPGPWLTRILVDLGATVIKVESPRGDPTRMLPPLGEDGMSTFFTTLHAGKQSVSIDMRSEAGRALLLELASRVDVLVESFRTGTLAAMGLDDATLEAANPRLVLCSLTGFGQQGPLATTAGHDINFLARTGLLGLGAPEGQVPNAPFAQVADLAGGSLPGVIAIQAALAERERTGRGRRLDLSLTRGVAGMGVFALSMAAAGVVEPPGRGYLTGGLPCYGCYRTADGRFLALGALEPHFFERFCAVLGHPKLAMFGLATGRKGAQTRASVQAVVETRTAAEWLEAFKDVDACVELVRTPQEALAVLEDIVQRVGGHDVLSLHLGTQLPELSAAPRLGAHGVAACEALGVDVGTVQAARDAGALKG